MADNLVIVESPAKAKTIKKYLGRDFDVLASYGHVRDLVPKEGAVDPDNGFAMKYQVLDKNERHVEAIARSLRKAKALYLATDPDREGEAIAWHLKEILAARGDLDGKDVHRVVFYEITRNAIRAAVEQPRGLSLELVNAQQARRALDYLVGFNLSPLLWKKVRRWRRRVARARDRSQAAPPQSGPALHHLDAAAGGGPQARLQCPAHHASRAAAVRGPGSGRRQRRAHHLHAHRLGVARRRSGGRDTRSGRAALRSAGGRGGAAHLQDQVEECTGGARGHPSHLGGDHAGGRGGQDRG